MEWEIAKAQGFPKLTLEEEVQRVNELLSKVESMVSHRLSQEFKSELKSCNEKLLEDLKDKPQDCDQYNNFSDLMNTQDIPLIHLKPSTTNSCAFSEVNREENAVHWYHSNQDETEHMSAVSAMVYPLSFDGKVSPSAFNTACNNMWQCNNEAKEYYYILSIGSECLDLKPQQQVISCEALDWLV